MPKVEIDYSNTIIYKITCKNPAITDVYVGHTTNFVQRKHAHKQSCNNNKSSNHACKLYEVIRANGGWANWQMEIINFFNCADHYAARKKEQEYFIELKATLNSIEPFPKPKVVLKQDNVIIDASINTKNFVCEVCSITCAKNNEWIRHINTKKHKTNECNKNNEEKLTVNCKCGKKYKDRSGLWRHEKTCTYEPESEKITKIYEKEDIIEVLLKENLDFKNLLLEIVKNNTELQKQNQEFQKQNREFQKQLLELYKPINAANQ
jgi:hypothetical protein